MSRYRIIAERGTLGGTDVFFTNAKSKTEAKKNYMRKVEKYWEQEPHPVTKIEINKLKMKKVIR